MDKFEGKLLKVKTDKNTIEGIMSLFDNENCKIRIENDSGNHDLNFDEILEISELSDLQEDPQPLKESDMYTLFYEAFNIYGPFEDQLIHSASIALKKFMKEIHNSSVKIIVDSDDIFGRIGLCFARLILGKVKSLNVELRCGLFDLNTLKYKNSFLNSGGIIDQTNSDEKPFSILLFACNRNCSFERNGNTSIQTLLLDIPSQTDLLNFTGLGLGFIPENSHICNKSYYLIDVGFGSSLAKKYKLPNNFKASLIKMDLPAK